MEWIKNLFMKLVGKKIQDEVDKDLEKWGISKAKLAGILMALLPAIESVSAAAGHPVMIPKWVYEVLSGAGIWALRDGMK